MSTPERPDEISADEISAELDEMEERIVGRRVDPPRSDDLGDETDEAEPTG